MDGKAKEQRVRRLAAHHGYTLRRFRTRTPEAPRFGQYYLVEPFLNLLVYGEAGADLDDITEYLHEKAA